MATRLDTKRLVVDVTADLHERVQLAAITSGKTIRQFVTEALYEKLERESPDIERRRAVALRTIRRELAGMVPPGVSLADELIAERRREAARESGE